MAEIGAVRWILLIGGGCAALSATASAMQGNTPETEELLRTIGPSIVQVRPGAGMAPSTGLIVDQSGILVTSLRAIEGAAGVVIRLPSGEEFEDIKVLAFDAKRDLVLLKFAGFGVPAAAFANSDHLKPGQAVFAVGRSAAGEGQATKGAVTAVEIAGSGSKVIRTDAPGFPGSAGGPLVNDRGEVVGIVTFDESGGTALAACPANNVRGLLSHQSPGSFADLPRGGRAKPAAAGAPAPAPTAAKGSVPSVPSVPSAPSMPSAGAAPPTGLAGNWTTPGGGPAFTLRDAGGLAVGEGLSPDGLPVSYDLRPSPGGAFVGKSRTTGSCSYFNPYKGWSGKEIEKGCLFETAIVITRVSEERVEGRVEVRDPPKDNGTSAYREWCNTCGASVTPRWVEFAWVRAE